MSHHTYNLKGFVQHALFISPHSNNYSGACAGAFVGGGYDGGGGGGCGGGG